MELLRPMWLWPLLPALLILGWIYLRSMHPMSGQRRGLAFVLRALLIVLAALFCAVPVLTRPSRKAAVVFIVDHSASMGQRGWRASMGRLSELQDELPPGSAVALVAAGEDPLVLRRLASEPLELPVEPPPTAENTNLAAALRLAAGLCPPHLHARLVLLSDGWETRGSARRTARQLASRGLRIDCVPVEGAERPDVWISKLRTSSSRLHCGAALELAAECMSSVAGSGTIRLFENGIEVETRELDLRPGGGQEVSFQRHPGKRGIYHYRVTLEGFPRDAIAANNQGRALVDVRGQPLVLYLHEDATEAKHLITAARREGLQLVAREPKAMPRSLAELATYDGVILGNVPAYALGEERMQLLRDYVEQLGGGLLMIGGEHSFGAGGYYRTPIEPILPVKMRAKDREERRATALILVLDRSGSMEGQKMVMCKQAAKATAQLLRSKDFLGVIAFDGSPHWIVPMSRMSPAAIAAIDSLTAGGGTTIYTAMQAGWTGIRQVQAGAKHMILLTDGHGGGGDFDRLAGAIRQEGITISTVAVGGGADVNLLRRIAARGQGTCYQGARPDQLKAIFTQDTMKHLGKVIREQPFVPVRGVEHPMLKGWSDDAPELLGYVKTERKATSQVLLVTDCGDPLLAHWRFGLGKVTAFTSGSGSRWAPLWIASWPGYDQFWAQVLRDTVRPPQGQQIDVRIRNEDEVAHVEVDLLESPAEYKHNAEVMATFYRLTTDSVGSQMTQTEEVACRQVAPGKYEYSFPLPEPGLYLARVRSGAVMASAGLVHAVSKEAPKGIVDTTRLENIATSSGGRILTADAELAAWRSERVGAERINLQPLILLLMLLVYLCDLCCCRLEHIQGLADHLVRYRD